MFKHLSFDSFTPSCAAEQTTCQNSQTQNTHFRPKNSLFPFKFETFSFIVFNKTFSDTMRICGCSSHRQEAPLCVSCDPRCGCDWWKETRREASDLPQAFIAKWRPVISETMFHFKAPDIIIVVVFVGEWGHLSLLGSALLL